MMDEFYNKTIEHPEENFSATEAERQGVSPLLFSSISAKRRFSTATIIRLL